MARTKQAASPANPGRRNGLRKPVKPVSTVPFTKRPLIEALVLRHRNGPPLHRAVKKGPRLFVLDTNVLMHDFTSLLRFEEHDIYLPILTLEELDNNKKGVKEANYNARHASLLIDELVTKRTGPLKEGISLEEKSGGAATGRLFLQTETISTPVPENLANGKADNQILAVVIHLEKQYPKRQVILVSKDINMRIKAIALGLMAEDYFNDKVMEDTELLHRGYRELPSDFWEHHGKGMESWRQGGHIYYRVTGPLVPSLLVNEFIYLEPKKGELPITARVVDISGKTMVFSTLTDYTHQKNNVWGVTARNREQNFALNLLMNPDIDFVSLLGQAGTGKTFLTLAAALQLVLELGIYTEIIITRVTVSVGEDIGFLPGTEEEKMNPWMGAVEDNLDALSGGTTKQTKDDKATNDEWGRAATNQLIRSRLKVKSLNFMRGRTFIKKFLIIDEAQNLTPKQMKTLITRAGPGTKVVCLGNISQIDTPYLTEGSSGITYVVDRFKGWEHSGHVTLQRGERSRLADHAAEAL